MTSENIQDYTVTIEGEYASTIPLYTGPYSSDYYQDHTNTFLRGDVNGDGSIGTIDAVMTLQYLNGDLELTAEQYDRAASAWDNYTSVDINDFNSIFYKAVHATFLGYNPEECATDVSVDISGPTTLLVGETGSFSSSVNSPYEDTWSRRWERPYDVFLANGGNYETSFDEPGIYTLDAVADSNETVCQYYGEHQIEVLPSNVDTYKVFIPLVTK